MKGKLKTIAFLLVLLLCSIISPTMNVLADTSQVVVTASSNGITSRIVISEKEDPEEGGVSQDCIVESRKKWSDQL